MPFVLVSAQFTIDKRCATTAARRGLAQEGEGDGSGGSGRGSVLLPAIVIQCQLKHNK